MNPKLKKRHSIWGISFPKGTWLLTKNTNKATLIHQIMTPDFEILLQTQRLWLRKFTLSDTHFLIKLLNTEEWLKYIGNRQVHQISDATAYMEEHILTKYNNNGFGWWLIETLEPTISSIGICGIIQRNYLPHPDIGFALLPQYFGQGYGFEASHSLLSFYQQQTGMEKILAITLPHNIPSIGLLEKLGMEQVGKVNPPVSGEELLLFSTI